MRIPQAVALVRSLTGRHRELVIELARREIAERYAGSAFGVLWAILTPFTMMVVYVGLFAFVFPVRFGNGGSPWTGATLILCSLVPWLAVVDVAMRAPGVFLAQRALVRQVVFPVEVLPARTVVACLVPWGVGSTVMGIVALLVIGPRPTMLLLPMLWLLQFIGMLGLCYLLATLGAWLRDLNEIVAIFTTIGLYTAPILLLPATLAALPRALSGVITANPFSHMVWCYQDVVVYGRLEHPASWIVFPVGALAMLLIGAAVFARARANLAEVL